MYIAQSNINVKKKLDGQKTLWYRTNSTVLQTLYYRTKEFIQRQSSTICQGIPVHAINVMKKVSSNREVSVVSGHIIHNQFFTVIMASKRECFGVIKSVSYKINTTALLNISHYIHTRIHTDMYMRSICRNVVPKL